MYELIIIGGGPGGVAAGVYAARKKIKTLLITYGFGGQSIISAGIENWIGTPKISGYDLGKAFEAHLRAQEEMEIVDDDLVTEIKKTENGFEVKTQSGATYQTKYILAAAGSKRRRLDVPGEKELDGKGVVYCSTCDAPIFKDKTVVIVGGGNAALESAIDSLPYASKIYLMVRGPELRGDQITQEKVKNAEKVTILYNSEIQKILGDQFVTGIEYLDKSTNETKAMQLDGVFVEIGAIPNTDFLGDLVQKNEKGEVIVDHKTQKTSCPGIWAVGDITDVLYKQNNISAGDGIKAVLNIYETIHKS